MRRDEDSAQDSQLNNLKYAETGTYTRTDGISVCLHYQDKRHQGSATYSCDYNTPSSTRGSAKDRRSM